MARQIKFEGRIISVPDDATDDEVRKILGGDKGTVLPKNSLVGPPEPPPVKPPPTFDLGAPDVLGDVFGEHRALETPIAKTVGATLPMALGATVHYPLHGIEEMAQLVGGAANPTEELNDVPEYKGRIGTPGVARNLINLTEPPARLAVELAGPAPPIHKLVGEAAPLVGLGFGAGMVKSGVEQAQEAAATQDADERFRRQIEAGSDIFAGTVGAGAVMAPHLLPHLQRPELPTLRGPKVNLLNERPMQSPEVQAAFKEFYDSKKSLPNLPEDMPEGTTYKVVFKDKLGNEITSANFDSRKAAHNAAAHGVNDFQVETAYQHPGQKEWKYEPYHGILGPETLPDLRRLAQEASFQRVMGGLNSIYDLIKTRSNSSSTFEGGSFDEFLGVTSKGGGEGSKVYLNPIIILKEIMADASKSPQYRETLKSQFGLDLGVRLVSTLIHEAAHALDPYNYHGDKYSSGRMIRGGSPEFGTAFAVHTPGSGGKFPSGTVEGHPHYQENFFSPGEITGDTPDMGRTLLPRGRFGAEMTAQDRFDWMHKALHDLMTGPEYAVIDKFYKEHTGDLNELTQRIEAYGKSDVGKYRTARPHQVEAFTPESARGLSGRPKVAGDNLPAGGGVRDRPPELGELEAERDTVLKTIRELRKQSDAAQDPNIKQGLRSKAVELADRAEQLTQEMLDAGGGGGTAQARIRRKGPPPPMHDREGWIRARQALATRMEVVRDQFKLLRSLGMAGVFEYQKGPTEWGKNITLSPEQLQSFKNLHNWFQQRYKEVVASGKKLGWKENYLSQLWKDDPAKVKAAFGRRLGLKPSFTMPSVFQNYEDGIKAGLTPRFDNLTDIAAWYERAASKAIADQKFYNYLKFNRFVRTPLTAPPEWQSFDPDRFPLARFTTKKGQQGVRVMKGPPVIVEKVNDYLRETKGPIKKFADFASWIKNIVISSGIPGTAINIHGFNTLMRKAISSARSVGPYGAYKEWAQGAGDLIRPDRAYQRLVGMKDKMVRAQEDGGLTMTAEEHFFDPTQKDSVMKRVREAWEEGRTMHKMISVPLEKLFGEKAAKIISKPARAWDAVSEFHQAVFDEPLFQKVIPAWKLQHYELLLAEFQKQAIPYESAAKLAGKLTNERFGGINWEMEGRSRATQDFLRFLLLAPDFLETQGRMAKGSAKALLNPKTPEGRTYMALTKNLAWLYLTANVANRISSGHWMWQNQPGHLFSIDLGETDGRKRYLKLFGTGADFVRLPFEGAEGALKGDFGAIVNLLRARLSIPLGAAGGLLFNSNYTGSPIFGEDIEPAKQLKGIGEKVADVFAPQYGSAAYRLAKGSTGLEPFAAQSLELPLAYPKARPEKKERPYLWESGPGHKRRFRTLNRHKK